MAAFLLTSAALFYFSRKIANEADGFRKGFAWSVGTFMMATVIDVNHPLCPRWAAVRYWRIKIVAYSALAVELALFAVIKYNFL
ncbi:hypothetical protein [Pelagibacterium halotolerans]|uniref:hypothetical protein n=1 Tax=Pelagibacterium halotolerans TaxID=531813 RepID=UPI00384FA606